MNQTEVNFKINISIPTPLRAFTNHSKSVLVSATNVDTALTSLIKQFPNLEQHLFEDGKLRNYVNIYLNDEDVRYLEFEGKTAIRDGDTLSIIPSIAGGVY
ncbi:MAG: MoaD/ThiS family protein [Candidatus Kariarchaeaceae archaeon]|jgi:adenylyltransferase/sulfurtransferase